MEITSIRIKKAEKTEQGKVVGVASISLDNCLVIHNIKLLDINGKRLLRFPDKKIKKYNLEAGKYEEKYEYADVVHPANREFRKYLEDEIFKIYDKEVEIENE